MSSRRSRRQTNSSSPVVFKIEDPTTWYCLEKKYALECPKCKYFLDNMTTAHVFTCYIKLYAYKCAKVPQNDIDQFLGLANGLVNTLEGGSICIHLDYTEFDKGNNPDIPPFYEKFRDQVSNGLTDILSDCGQLEGNTCSWRTDDDHVFFDVCNGTRPLSTCDYRLKLPRHVGLKPASRLQVKALTKIVQGQQGHTGQRNTQPNDPPFLLNQLLPASFVETESRQMKAIHEGKIKECLAKEAVGVIVPYVCAFATLDKGGCIYLGLSEANVNPANPDSQKNGRYVCHGVHMGQTEVNAFKDKLRLTIEDEFACYPQERHVRSWEELVKVDIIDVKETEHNKSASTKYYKKEGASVNGADQKLVVIKVTVHHFNAIFWHTTDLRDGLPLAFRVVSDDDGSSKVSRISFEEWLAALQTD